MAETKKFLIRFNTKHGESNLVWRVFEDGEEKLASSINIEVAAWSESSLEGEVKKWNLACCGVAVWTGDKVLIK